MLIDLNYIKLKLWFILILAASKIKHDNTFEITDN